VISSLAVILFFTSSRGHIEPDDLLLLYSKRRSSPLTYTGEKESGNYWSQELFFDLRFDLRWRA